MFVVIVDIYLKVKNSFQTISAEKDASLLCSGCWLKIETFHDFYQMVEEIHKKPIEQVNTDTWANDNPENLNIKVEPEQISFNDVDDDDAVDDINSHIADTSKHFAFIHLSIGSIELFFFFDFRTGRR